MIRTKAQELEAKRQDVRREYVKNGISPEYEKLFDELHELNMAFMEFNHRFYNGMLPKPKKEIKEIK
jgi:hypothetical protein